MNRIVAGSFLLGIAMLAASAGCTIRNTPPLCQKMEDEWGDVVDAIGHHSPVDQPWHDPQYCKRAVYRIDPSIPVYDYSEEAEEQRPQRSKGESQGPAIADPPPPAPGL